MIAFVVTVGIIHILSMAVSAASMSLGYYDTGKSSLWVQMAVVPFIVCIVCVIKRLL